MLVSTIERYRYPSHTDIQRLLFNHILSLSLEALSQPFLKPNCTLPELAALRNAVGESQGIGLGRI